MRWIITDRASGKVFEASQPSNHKERESLKALIRNTSALALKSGPLGNL